MYEEKSYQPITHYVHGDHLRGVGRILRIGAERQHCRKRRGLRSAAGLQGRQYPALLQLDAFADQGGAAEHR